MISVLFCSSIFPYSPSRYYTMNRGISADYYGMYGAPPYPEEYSLYPPGIRPDSICSMSAAYDRMPPRWTAEEKRRSLRDTALYGPPREPQWMMGPPGPHPAYYTQLESTQGTMRRLSLQPRSRSVPRSPSSSSGGAYSPGPPNFISPARSPSVRFDRVPGRLRDEGIYADPSVYGMRRSLSSPKVKLIYIYCMCISTRVLKTFKTLKVLSTYRITQFHRQHNYL